MQKPGETNKRLMGKKSPQAHELGVIILNKPFLGGWLNHEGRIGHEIIDFLQTDKGEHYVYNNPWGVCPKDIWVEGTTGLTRTEDEKYSAKYMVLTSATEDKDFSILYVIELEEKIHRQHTHKELKPYQDAQNAVIKVMKSRSIRYNKKRLDEIYGRESLFLTFKASKMYEAKKPIVVTGLSYNFQRNKGYIYEDEFVDDYKAVKQRIEDAIEKKDLIEFKPLKVAPSGKAAKKAGGKTFLDLIGKQDSEQAYTNMLHSILTIPGVFADFCVKFKDKPSFDGKAPTSSRFFDQNGTFQVGRETSIVQGRMDICAESDDQRVVVENKVYSGLNGVKEDKTQLSTYHSWAKSTKRKEPLCFVAAPDFRTNEIGEEILESDKGMESAYVPITYGEIADFIEEEKGNGKVPTSYLFYFLLDQIIDAFRNLSYPTKAAFYSDMFLKATL